MMVYKLYTTILDDDSYSFMRDSSPFCPHEIRIFTLVPMKSPWNPHEIPVPHGSRAPWPPIVAPHEAAVPSQPYDPPGQPERIGAVESSLGPLGPQLVKPIVGAPGTIINNPTCTPKKSFQVIAFEGSDFLWVPQKKRCFSWIAGNYHANIVVAFSGFHVEISWNALTDDQDKWWDFSDHARNGIGGMPFALSPSHHQLKYTGGINICIYTIIDINHSQENGW